MRYQWNYGEFLIFKLQLHINTENTQDHFKYELTSTSLERQLAGEERITEKLETLKALVNTYFGKKKMEIKSSQ